MAGKALQFNKISGTLAKHLTDEGCSLLAGRLTVEENDLVFLCEGKGHNPVSAYIFIFLFIGNVETGSWVKTTC